MATTHLGNVAHQHVDIYTKDNNKSLTMSIITLEMLLSTKDASTHEWFLLLLLLL